MLCAGGSGRLAEPVRQDDAIQDFDSYIRLYAPVTKTAVPADGAGALAGRGEVLDATFTSSVSGGLLIVTMRAECLEDIAVYTPANQ